MSKVIYGLHTGQAKKQITYREAKDIEMLFGTSFPDEAHACSQFFQDGISKLWIEEIPSKVGMKYWIHVRVNMARAVGIGEYCLMPYTIPNVKKMIRMVSNVLKKLNLQGGNADFGEWKWERFDSAFDVEVTYPELYLSLLDKSLDVNAYKRKCGRKPFTPANPNVCESLRFGNASYVYNVYIKLADLVNKGITITPEILQEVQNIVRVERQNQSSAIKQLLQNGLVNDLASVRAVDGILKVMVDDMEAFWGKGTYYSSYEIKAKFSSNPEIQKLVPTMAAFTKKSLEDEYGLYTADVRKVFEEHGIIPVGILKEDVAKYQIKELQGLYNIVTACYSVVKKRVYHVFPVGHWASDGRFKAGITVHKVNETRKLPLTIWGHTVEEYEEKVLQELMTVYATNVKYHCANNKSIPDLIEKSADDILRFYQVVESKDVTAKVREYIRQMNLKKKR